jgi:hypothetical protein
MVKNISFGANNILDVSNLQSYEDVVDMLIPKLQRRGVYRTEYPAPAPGGTFRESLQCKPRKPGPGLDHPSAKFRWNAPKAINGHAAEESLL